MYPGINEVFLYHGYFLDSSDVNHISKLSNNKLILPFDLDSVL